MIRSYKGGGGGGSLCLRGFKGRDKLFFPLIRDKLVFPLIDPDLGY